MSMHSSWDGVLCHHTVSQLPKSEGSLISLSALLASHVSLRAGAAVCASVASECTPPDMCLGALAASFTFL